MKLEINSFSDNLIGFECHKLSQAKVLWINRSNVSNIDEKDFDEDTFLDSFAYANKKSGCFIDIEFNTERSKVLYAERYGGVGVGGNGGGVRCGNSGLYQIKGTGINPLLGDHDNYNHSTGNYSLAEAVREVISSQIYATILPVGTAKIYGLISTGTSRFKGDQYGYRLPLAITVREACLRPAHFLPQPFFKPFSRYKHLLKGETARVRGVNKELARQFSDNNAFIMYLGRFLAASANQLAFARLFRIAHGAYSPSNLSIDGRWLDLTNMTMVPAGVNYAAARDTLPFLDEAYAPLHVVEQLLYNFGKFNQTDLNIAPLASYYQEQYEAYSRHYLAALLGLNPEELGYETALQEKGILTKYISGLIEKNTQINIGPPNDIEKTDLLALAIEKLFLSLNDRDEESLENVCDSTVLQAFQNLLYAAYGERSIKSQNLSSFFISSAIKSFRKLYFSPFFYLGRIQSHIEEFIKVQDQEKIANYINSYAESARWIFDRHDSREKIFLFKSNDISIYHSIFDDNFQVSIKHKQVINFDNIMGLWNFLKSMDENNFCVAGFCFKSGLFRLINIISEIEKFSASFDKDKDIENEFISFIS